MHETVHALLCVTRMKQLVKALVSLLWTACTVVSSLHGRMSCELMLCYLVCVQGSYVSYWAHLGGFVCGLFPSFFFLPNLKDKRYDNAT